MKPISDKTLDLKNELILIIMEELSIEKMEMKRYRALWIRTIASTLLMICLVWVVYFEDNGDRLSPIMNYIYMGVILVSCVITWVTANVFEKIQKDKRLTAALDSEIYKEYKYKSLATGFYATLAAGLLVFIFGNMLNLTVHTASLIIIFIAQTASQIQRLILYNPYKDGK